MRTFDVNELVIHHQPVASSHPGPEARDVRPTEQGELYTYVVDHFWRIARLNSDGTLDAVSLNAHRHRLRQTDPALEKAGWWRRTFHRRLFPGI